MSVVSLLTAVRTRLLALVTSPSLSGIWYGLAPDETAGTYITYFVPANEEGQSMGSSPARWEDVTVTIDVWTDGTSPLVVTTIAEQIRNLFNVTQPLGSSVPLCIAAQRTSYAILADTEGGYHASLDYTFTMEE